MIFENGQEIPGARPETIPLFPADLRMGRVTARGNGLVEHEPGASRSGMARAERRGRRKILLIGCPDLRSAFCDWDSSEPADSSTGAVDVVLLDPSGLGSAELEGVRKAMEAGAFLAVVGDAPVPPGLEPDAVFLTSEDAATIHARCEQYVRMREIEEAAVEQCTLRHRLQSGIGQGDLIGRVMSYYAGLFADVHRSTEERERMLRKALDREHALRVKLAAELDRRQAAEQDQYCLGQRYRELVEKSTDVIWETDAAGTYVYCSPNAESMFGYAHEEVVGRTPFDFMPPAEADRVRMEFGEIAGQGASFSLLTHDVIRKDGTTAVIECSGKPIFDGEGRLCGYRGVDRDITERVMAERNQARLLMILQASSDFIGFTEPDGRLLHINRAGRALVGLDEQVSLTGYSIKDFHPSWAYNLLMTQAIPAAIQDGVWTGEAAFISRAGCEIPVSMVVVAHKDAAGNVDMVGTISRDVSARRKLEDELVQSQKMEAVGRLAGGIAHDFNNLLTAINGYADLLYTQFDPGDPRAADLLLIRKAGERAGELTRQLLTFSRKQSFSPRCVRVTEVVHEMQRLLLKLIGEHIELVTVPVSTHDWVHVDPNQFEQVLINLAVNARDAMPEGGRLTIESRVLDVTPLDRHEHGYVPIGRYVLVTVEDTGAGIADKDKPHIFEPFYTTKEQGKGTGLGLATCYAIVERCGGYLRVDSEIGRGSRFMIYLPHAIPPVEVCPEDGGRLLLPFGTESILVVEDNEDVRSYAATVLANQGYRTFEASDGEDALRFLDASPDLILDLIVSDLVMPRMGGRELALHVRRRLPGSKLLFITGYDRESPGIADTEIKDVACLQKPFTPEALSQKVREVLDVG